MNLNNFLFIKKEKYHTIINLFGIKLKFISKKALLGELKNLQYFMQRMQIPTLYLADLTNNQKIWYLSQRFFEECGYFPNLKNPKSFNEKINWMKLNYYNPLEQRCIDKYEFKNYIKEVLGEGYTIPLLGVYDNVNDIQFEKLPRSFVIKITTLGSGVGVKIIKNKAKLNVDKIKYELDNLMQDWNSIYWYCLSRGYKDIKPRIIAEEYIEQENGQLCDYKFHCFHGEIKIILAVKDRIFGKGHKMSFLTPDWKELNIHRGDANLITKVEKPAAFDEMVKIAQKLSAPFPFVRVDFYNAKGKVYVGELTFTPMGGFGKYVPEKWDYILGEWLDLNKINKEYIIKEG